MNMPEEKNPTSNTSLKAENKVSKQNKKLNIIITCCITLAILLIASGIYISYLSNPKRILGTTIDDLTSSLRDITLENEKTNLGKNYTMTSKIKVNDDSMPSPKITQNKNLSTFLNLLNSLEKTDTTLTLSQDYTNKKLLLTWTSKLNNQEVLPAKYLVENSTEYYFVKDHLTTYVNNGSSNYFEALSEEANNKENIEYIYELIKTSLKNNLKEEYFSKYKTTANIAGKDQEVTKVSLKLNNTRLKEIASAILTDLKTDTRANKILTSIFKDFSKVKIKDSTKFLKQKETITINIYTSNITYQPKKYEYVYQNNLKEEKITYEKQPEEDIVYVIKDNKALYKLKVTNSTGKIKVAILDANKNTNLGKIILEKTAKRTSLLIDFKNNNKSINIDYNVKLSDIKVNKSYKKNVILNAKIVENSANIINFNINSENKVIARAKISEDVSDSVLASSIPKEQEPNIFKRYINRLIKRLS